MTRTYADFSQELIGKVGETATCLKVKRARDSCG